MGIRTLERLLAWSLGTFSALSRRTQLAFAFGMILVVGGLDYVSGYEISLSILYLLPITIATWYAGRNVGVLYAVLCGLSWFVVVKFGQEPFTSVWIPVWNDGVRLAFFLTHALLLDAFRRRLQAEQTLARTDALTGVLNFRAFHETLSHALAMARRHGGPLTLSYVDLDHFKRINDTYGHSEGDRILQLCGRYLRQSTRSTDEVARLGGDEFVVLMPDTGTDGAEVVINKFHAKLSALLHADGEPIGCSIGAVSFVDLPPTEKALVEIADELMYTVKENGRGSAVLGEYRGQACKIVKHLAFANSG